jgi:DNA-binding transcriptional LysR family regulator
LRNDFEEHGHMPKGTLEQWRMLKAVVDAGGFAKAATLVHKSPSSINHAVQKLQAQLGVPVLEVRGRRAELTDAGAALLRRAENLLGEALEIETLAVALAEGVESEIALGLDQFVPQDAVVDALDRFATEFPHTRVQVHETMFGGGGTLLQSGAVDLIIGPSIPADYLAEVLGQIRMICVAHPEHPLARRAPPLSLRDLRLSRQVVIRDPSDLRKGDGGWLDPERRWTVGNVQTAMRFVSAGFAFAWLPECVVRRALDLGELVALELEAGATRVVPFSLAFADHDRAGSATRGLAGLLCSVFRERVPEDEAFPDWWSMARCGSRARL